jgi:hypothetical protein
MSDNGPHYHCTELMLIIGQWKDWYDIVPRKWIFLEAGEAKTLIDSHHAQVMVLFHYTKYTTAVEHHVTCLYATVICDFIIALILQCQISSKFFLLCCIYFFSLTNIFSFSFHCSKDFRSGIEI